MSESLPDQSKPLSRRTLKAVAAWLRTEGGRDGAHGSIPAFHVVANHIERRLAEDSYGRNITNERRYPG